MVIFRKVQYIIPHNVFRVSGEGVDGHYTVPGTARNMSNQKSIATCASAAARKYGVYDGDFVPVERVMVSRVEDINDALTVKKVEAQHAPNVEAQHAAQ